MLHNFMYNLVHMPIMWDFIIPIAIIAVFCILLMWEGEYGHAARKRFKVMMGRPENPDIKTRNNNIKA